LSAQTDNFNQNLLNIKRKRHGASIFSSVIRETSALIEEYSDGSSPSEDHCGGWEGLGKDGGELVL